MRGVEEGRTTAAVQRYLDDLAEVSGDSEAEPVIRQLLARGVRDGKEIGRASCRERVYLCV